MHMKACEVGRGKIGMGRNEELQASDNGHTGQPKWQRDVAGLFKVPHAKKSSLMDTCRCTAESAVRMADPGTMVIDSIAYVANKAR